jgi:hypothetical protein
MILSMWPHDTGVSRRAYRLVASVLGALLLLCAIGAVFAQGPTAAAKQGASSTAAVDIEVLKGAWVRPDGGYVILIDSVAAGGELQAMYFNPNPLPFAKAQASREGGTPRAQFELRAGGYNGSTYELRYEPGSDRLVGTYYQAVARQSFEVQFVRKPLRNAK